MARVKNGLLGMVTGKIGPLVVYSMHGKVYARTTPSVVSGKQRSLAQQAQNYKLKLITGLLNSCTDFIKIGYRAKSITHNKTTHNLSQSYHLKHGVTGTFPEQQINWETVQLSSGSLPAPENLTVSLREQDITVHWETKAKLTHDEANQQTMVLLFCTDTQQVYSEIYKGSKKDRQQTLALKTRTELGYTYHLYFCFKNLLDDEVSDSVYGGCLNL
ncbi:DUF6266 family protein [Pedobacter antarcticus]|uniref:DUF6266 family protein n=1 Tax=Pedobacter antarcticus TaxID=34086 RepID=UPI00292FDB02|nr:DUF6266 family protein [Pedobacter antarcticus]